MQISFEDLLITFSQWKQQHQNAVKRFDITIIVFIIVLLLLHSSQKGIMPSRGILKKWCPENMLQIYRTPMPQCNFNKVALATSVWVFCNKFAPYFQNTYS